MSEQAKGSPIRGQRFVVRHEETIRSDADTVFPLLCPVEEYKWIDRWDCDLIYTASGRAETNCIFVERQLGPILFGRDQATYWTFSRYEPALHRVEFVLSSLPVAITKLDVVVTPVDAHTTTARWEMTITALQPDAALDASTDGRAKLVLAVLARALKQYCEQGKLYPLNKANLLAIGLSTGLTGLVRSHLGGSKEKP